MNVERHLSAGTAVMAELSAANPVRHVLHFHGLSGSRTRGPQDCRARSLGVRLRKRQARRPGKLEARPPFPLRASSGHCCSRGRIVPVVLGQPAAPLKPVNFPPSRAAGRYRRGSIEVEHYSSWNLQARRPCWTYSSRSEPSFRRLGWVGDAYPVIRYAFSPEHTATTGTADDEVPEIWYYLNWSAARAMREVHLWQWRYTDEFEKRNVFPCRLTGRGREALKGRRAHRRDSGDPGRWTRRRLTEFAAAGVRADGRS